MNLVQLLSRLQLFATPWTTARQASLSITNSWSLLKLMSIESVMPSNHLILCCRLFLLPSVFPSIRVFSNESVLRIRSPEYWSFSFSISPSNEYSGLISFRMDWFDLLVVQGTLKIRQALFWLNFLIFTIVIHFPYSVLPYSIATNNINLVNSDWIFLALQCLKMYLYLLYSYGGQREWVNQEYLILNIS